MKRPAAKKPAMKECGPAHAKAVLWTGISIVDGEMGTAEAKTAFEARAEITLRINGKRDGDHLLAAQDVVLVQGDPETAPVREALKRIYDEKVGPRLAEKAREAATAPKGIPPAKKSAPGQPPPGFDAKSQETALLTKAEIQKLNGAAPGT